MANQNKKTPTGQNHGSLNTKLLITAASITITIGGAIGLLSEQLTASQALGLSNDQGSAGDMASGTTSDAGSASGISITYLTPPAPLATSTSSRPAVATIEVSRSDEGELDNDLDSDSDAGNESAAPVDPVAEPASEPAVVATAVVATDEPIVEPTAEPLVIVPRRSAFVARSRSSR